MTYDHITHIPRDYWLNMELIESKGDIKLMEYAKEERFAYCDRCGEILENYQDEHECEG